MYHETKLMDDGTNMLNNENEICSLLTEENILMGELDKERIILWVTEIVYA